MSRNKFITEIDINASKKMLFPYLRSVSGLSQWVADDVTIDEDKIYNFIWDGEDHKAKLAAYKLNDFVRFEFLPEEGDDEGDNAYFEFKLRQSELTQSVSIQVTDYTDEEDDEELEDMWYSLIGALKETVGG